jgi:DNA-binding MarR family transcriptional regulator
MAPRSTATPTPATAANGPAAGIEAPTDLDALDLCLRFGQAQAALAKRFDRALSGHHGLSYADFVLLTHLGRAAGGRLRRIDLATAVGMTASGVTRALAPLERIGLVERESNPRDARVAYAALTGTGRGVLDDVHASAERVAAAALADAGWSPAEVAALVELLGRLGASGLPPASDAPPAGADGDRPV